MLGLGPAAVALIAVLLAWRNPLVLLLAAGSSAFLLAALALFYEPFPGDLTRMDGHARNFALIAVLLALAIRLATLRTRYRYVAAAGIIALATWPTAASPARALSLGLEREYNFPTCRQGHVSSISGSKHDMPSSASAQTPSPTLSARTRRLTREYSRRIPMS